MPSAGFELATRASGRPQILPLDRSAAGINEIAVQRRMYWHEEEEEEEEVMEYCTEYLLIVFCTPS